MAEELNRPTLPVSVTIPARTIIVASALQLEILRIMSQSGLSRSWRIAGQLLAAGLAENENSVRNVLRRLTAAGLIDDYRERGSAIGWTPVRGGGRRLVVLTETGQVWCKAAFGRQPAACELYAALSRHQSTEHGVGVLEACDYLRQAGYAVDEAPAAVLAGTQNRWGSRTEPDLLVEMDGALWPVEVQREVSERATVKWQKCLALAGKLALVLFSSVHQAKQQRLLQNALAFGSARAVRLRISSLESMREPSWVWVEP